MFRNGRDVGADQSLGDIGSVTQTKPPADGDEAERIAIKVEDETRRMPGKTWQSLAKKKQYKTALLTARKIGLEKLGQTLSSEELWSLATTARYAGAADDAAMMFEAHRRRFSESTRSRTAAYLLAVLALDQQRDQEAAKRWFETYLDEAPNGTLYEEALGRLMHLNARMGLDTAARRHAAHYLRKYPNGHFSEQARSVLSP